VRLPSILVLRVSRASSRASSRALSRAFGRAFVELRMGLRAELLQGFGRAGRA